MHLLLLVRHLAADGALLGDLALDALGGRRLVLEVALDVGRDERVVDVVRLARLVLARDEVRLVQNAQLLDAVELVLLRVVVPVALEDDALVPREVVRVDGDAVVQLGVTRTNAAPVACMACRRTSAQCMKSAGRTRRARGAGRRTRAGGDARSISRSSMPVVSGRKMAVTRKPRAPKGMANQNLLRSER